MALTFLVGIQLARYLGVEGYGIYGSVFAVASIGVATSSGGVTILCTRNTAALRAKSDMPGVRRLLIWAVRHIMICLGPVSALAALAIWSVMGLPFHAALVGAGLIWLLAVLAVFAAFLRGLDDVTLGVALNAMIRPLVFSALLALTAWLALPLTPTLALTMAGIAICISIIIGSVKLLTVLRAPRALGSAEEAPEWYRAVMTMRMAEILRIAEAMMPLIVVGMVASMSEAGAFRVAASIAVLGSIAVSVAHLALPPSFARLNANGDFHGMKRLASITAVLITMPSLILLLLSLELGEWAIVHTFGEEFKLAAVPTSIMLASNFLLASSGASQVVLETKHAESAVNAGFTLSLTMTFLLVFSLTPTFGAIGAALAVMGGALVRSAAMTTLCLVRTGINPSILSVGSLFSKTSESL